KNSVLFTDTECLVLSPEFKLPDESQVLLRVPRGNNMYNVNLKSIVLSVDLTCLFAKATIDESTLWHRRMGHINFKTMNKLVKGNLVRGLPTKVFENDNTCVACKKGKQHRASCKTKPVSSVDQTLYRLHMDLFGPTFVKSLNKKSYCLVVTDDYSRFTWVFFLATKDETSPILKTFISGLENQLSLKVKVIRSDNGTEFKNNDLNQFCGIKGIKREFNLLLTILFWVEAVNTACYVQNRALVTKPQNKTPYELLHGRTSSISFMRPFGCPETILNTLDSLGNFDGNVDEGFLVGYSVSSKAFRVLNIRTRIVQETLHVNFLENKPNVTRSDPTWLFDIDSLTNQSNPSAGNQFSMNYQPVTARNQSNPSADFQDKFDAEKAGEESDQQYVLFPVWSSGSTNPQNTDGDAAFDENEPEFDEKKPKSEVNVSPNSSAQSRKQDDKTKREAKGKSAVESFIGYRNLSAEFENLSDNSINLINAAGTLVPTIGQIFPNSTNTFSADGPSNVVASPTHGKSSFIDTFQLLDDHERLELEDITYSDDEDDVGAEADFNNLETSITMFNDDFHTCMFAYFLSQEEPKGVHQALKDPSWIEAMQEELLQFKIQKVWVLVDLPYGKRAIGFEDPDHSDKVHKVVKALYGLHQAPRAWQKGDILLVQIYVDDIIFGLQVKQKKDGIFISQDKYVAEILRKFGLTDGKSSSTPIDTEKPLLKDPDGEAVD
nr:hypothetical protein [Tanacetum cinerariifolium]